MSMKIDFKKFNDITSVLKYGKLQRNRLSNSKYDEENAFIIALVFSVICTLKEEFLRNIHI